MRRCLPLSTIATVPELGSINDILRQHNRQRLYVRPITWTSDQLRLLECQFVLQKGQFKEPRESRAAPKPESADAQSVVAGKDTTLSRERRLRSDANHAAVGLFKSPSMAVKKFSVRKILATCNIQYLE